MGRQRRFESLLSPGRIGSLETRNRIVMSPMGSNLGQEDGHVGERLERYYEARARGGVGLIILGVGAIAWPSGACNPRQIAISDDAFLPGLSKLTDRLHAHGAKAAIQLQHAGKVATRDIAAGRPMWVPSALPYKAGDLMADLTPQEIQGITGDFSKPGARMILHEMTAADIEELISRFADAAGRAKRAGFDGVELHAGHGYILSAFLSPATNRREDAYGGTVENRARLLLEVIQAVKERVGQNFPVWCRLDSKEFRTENGIAIEDARRTAELAQAAGIDAIHVSAYADPSLGVAFTEAPLVHEPCGYVALAEGIKRRVEVPVIAVGRIEPEQGDAIIREGKADFIAMGRKLLADPELPRKLEQARPEDVRPCVYCYTCVGKIFLNQNNCCAVNPATGREVEFELESAKKPKHVLVVGGGPAGMEAARVAALRGHRVTLCEKSGRLGGTLLFSALVNEANSKLVEYLETQVRKLPVEIRLGQAVTPELVRSIAPDVTLVAVGARREPPPIPGARRPEVLSGDELRDLVTGEDGGAAASKLSLPQRGALRIGALLGVAEHPERARALSRHWMPVGKRVAVIGGELVGVELAEFLAERGRQVSVLEETKWLATEMAPPRRWRGLHHLRERGVDLFTQVRVEAIRDEGVVFTDQEGERRTLEVDSVILATGVRENRELGEALTTMGCEVHLLGDCSGVGYIEGAILDGARIARSL
jgi:2,4-dienoyl-CoA reductase-like NADH-dependent reductase (Old Yellow Enzyme family)